MASIQRICGFPRLGMNAFALGYGALLPGTWYLTARIDQTVRGTPVDLSWHPILILAAFVIGLAALCAWRLESSRRAAQNGDAEAFNQHVDYPKVRASLKEQFSALVAQKLGVQKDPDNPFAALGSLIGLGVVPIRAALFALTTDPALLVVIQVLDGLSGATLGVLTALVIADLTKGTGRFNLAQGLVGTLSGIGASLSTSISGLVVDRLGHMAGFVSVTAIGVIAVVILWAFMPETKSSAVQQTEKAAIR